MDGICAGMRVTIHDERRGKEKIKGKKRTGKLNRARDLLRKRIFKKRDFITDTGEENSQNWTWGQTDKIQGNG